MFLGQLLMDVGNEYYTVVNSVFPVISQWSGDGNTAINVKTESGHGVIQIYDVVGETFTLSTNLVALNSGALSHVAISYDGTVIAAAHYGPTFQLTIWTKVEGSWESTTRTNFLGAVKGIAISKDNSAIAFGVDYSLHYTTLHYMKYITGVWVSDNGSGANATFSAGATVNIVFSHDGNTLIYNWPGNKCYIVAVTTGPGQTVSGYIIGTFLGYTTSGLYSTISGDGLKIRIGTSIYTRSGDTITYSAAGPANNVNLWWNYDSTTTVTGYPASTPAKVTYSSPTRSGVIKNNIVSGIGSSIACSEDLSIMYINNIMYKRVVHK